MILKMEMNTIPRVHVVGQIKQPMGWENALKKTKSYILILVWEGDMQFEVGEKSYALNKGDYLILQAGEGYRVRSHTSCQYTFLHFYPGSGIKRIGEAEAVREAAKRQAQFDQARGDIPYSIPAQEECCIFVPVSGSFSSVQEKIRLFLTECDIHRYELTPHARLQIELNVAQIFCLLDDYADAAQSKAHPPALSRILLYIHEHYMEPITLALLSEKFQLSRQYIMRLFQQHLHTTATHYIQQIKLSHAQELLRYSTFRVNEVAEILGFGNAYYFCRLFKRQFQMTPTEFIGRELYKEQAKKE